MENVHFDTFVEVRPVTVIYTEMEHTNLWPERVKINWAGGSIVLFGASGMLDAFKQLVGNTNTTVADVEVLN